jgi:hypothetical protein
LIDVPSGSTKPETRVDTPARFCRQVSDNGSVAEDEAVEKAVSHSRKKTPGPHATGNADQQRQCDEGVYGKTEHHAACEHQQRLRGVQPGLGGHLQRQAEDAERGKTHDEACHPHHHFEGCLPEAGQRLAQPGFDPRDEHAEQQAEEQQAHELAFGRRLHDVHRDHAQQDFAEALAGAGLHAGRHAARIGVQRKQFMCRCAVDDARLHDVHDGQRDQHRDQSRGHIEQNRQPA